VELEVSRAGGGGRGRRRKGEGEGVGGGGREQATNDAGTHGAGDIGLGAGDASHGEHFQI